MGSKVLVALKQAKVSFYGYEVLVVLLSDGRIAASLRSLCNMLRLARHGQVERIRRDANLAERLLLAVVKTPGGSQRMEVLLAEAIPDWAMGIQIDQIAEEKRPLVSILKEQAHEAFARALLKPEPEQAAQPTPEPEAEAAAQTGPARGGSGAAADSPWERLFAGLDEVQEGLGDVQRGLEDVQGALHDLRREEQSKAGRLVVVEEWLTSLDRRVAAGGQGSAGGLGWMPLLNAAHLADVRALLRALEQTTGRTQAQLEQEVIETFGVSAINAIPDEQWEDVLAWCLWRTRM